MLLLFLPILLLLSSSNAQQNNTKCPSSRIIGGENALIGTFPYMVSLEVLGHHHCGGSIVSKYYIITAAQCVESPANLLTIRAGSSLRGRGGSVHHVDRVVQHEKYSINEYGIPINDIAVLKLKEPIIFDDDRQPIALFNMNENAEPGVMAVIIGWGDRDNGTPVQLQSVKAPVIVQSLCNKAYEEFGGLPDRQLCTIYYGRGGKDSCKGDFGGPLTINGRLAGIISWGNGCTKEYYPGVYTEISRYRLWINEHVIINKN